MRYVGYTILEQSRRLPSSMNADDALGEVLETKIEIKVFPGKVVFEMTDDGNGWKPIDITNTPLGRLLLAAEQEPNGANGLAKTDRTSG
ncbi:MAG: hypothetical protein WBQ89_22660 [Candidatus Acidiferrum sp.]